MEKNKKIKYFIHPTADVQSSKIGVDTTIWQYCVVLPEAEIGSNCNINCHVFIENDVTIGNNVTVKSGVQVWNGITLESNVFIGPNVTFTNDLYPRSKRSQFPLVRTIVKEGASIGGNATILAGKTIGTYAMVGAGSVITKDINDFELWIGNPAKHAGYVTEYGEVLDKNLQSKKTGQQFTWKDHKIEKNPDCKITAEGISMRLVEKSDAEFILSLRTDKRLSQYISQTSPEIQDQINWIKEYQDREAKQQEFYFVYEDSTNNPWGVIRLYNFSDEGFTIGSWVCYPGNEDHIAVKAWLLAVEFGFAELKFDTCFLDVRKKNLYVLYYLKLFNPVLIKEDELNYYFKFSKEAFLKRRHKVTTLLNIKL
ncbi:Carbonic anhydrase or acetyltransferase, isoleucine patch superfamily [Mariniphaga anaerophila]|uniref:Carbonic anhydrase or acetyltransferase, isoleucine patch superfamily n=1 Tax=Mariniphaga anaerophila TaxID=1484053 RepID=A0A1M5BM22_9BACT|nr:GNAT family N-acetyltransferase [Mariniphaga anaerophila]SHF43277.1 Carbonic anhydrase or acetyltransferase, isoleucine patch superfamily [Mariniphaga anaerophila]